MCVCAYACVQVCVDVCTGLYVYTCFMSMHACVGMVMCVLCARLYALMCIVVYVNACR